LTVRLISDIRKMRPWSEKTRAFLVSALFLSAKAAGAAKK